MQKPFYHFDRVSESDLTETRFTQTEELAEGCKAPGRKHHTLNTLPWLHHPSFTVSEARGLLSRYCIINIFCLRGRVDENRNLGSTSTKA